MASHGEVHVPGYRPHVKGGWGVAIFISVLAAVLWISAYVIHRNTYLHPRDTRWKAIGADRGHGAPPPAPASGTAPAADAHGGH